MFEQKINRAADGGAGRGGAGGKTFAMSQFLGAEIAFAHALAANLEARAALLQAQTELNTAIETRNAAEAAAAAAQTRSVVANPIETAAAAREAEARDAAADARIAAARSSAARIAAAEARAATVGAVDALVLVDRAEANLVSAKAAAEKTALKLYEAKPVLGGLNESLAPSHLIDIARKVVLTNAARDAARNAARDAARNAARDAARDAATSVVDRDAETAAIAKFHEEVRLLTHEGTHADREAIEIARRIIAGTSGYVRSFYSTRKYSQYIDECFKNSGAEESRTDVYMVAARVQNANASYESAQRDKLFADGLEDSIDLYSSRAEEARAEAVRATARLDVVKALDGTFELTSLIAGRLNIADKLLNYQKSVAEANAVQTTYDEAAVAAEDAAAKATAAKDAADDARNYAAARTEVATPLPHTAAPDTDASDIITILYDPAFDRAMDRTDIATRAAARAEDDSTRGSRAATLDPGALAEQDSTAKTIDKARDAAEAEARAEARASNTRITRARGAETHAAASLEGARVEAAIVTSAYVATYAATRTTSDLDTAAAAAAEAAGEAAASLGGAYVDEEAKDAATNRAAAEAAAAVDGEIAGYAQSYRSHSGMLVASLRHADDTTVSATSAAATIAKARSVAADEARAVADAVAAAKADAEAAAKAAVDQAKAQVEANFQALKVAINADAKAKIAEVDAVDGASAGERLGIMPISTTAANRRAADVVEYKRRAAAAFGNGGVGAGGVGELDYSTTDLDEVAQSIAEHSINSKEAEQMARAEIDRGGAYHAEYLRCLQEVLTARGVTLPETITSHIETTTKELDELPLVDAGPSVTKAAARVAPIADRKERAMLVGKRLAAIYNQSADLHAKIASSDAAELDDAHAKAARAARAADIADRAYAFESVDAAAATASYGGRSNGSRIDHTIDYSHDADASVYGDDDYVYTPTPTPTPTPASVTADVEIARAHHLAARDEAIANAAALKLVINYANASARHTHLISSGRSDSEIAVARRDLLATNAALIRNGIIATIVERINADPGAGAGVSEADVAGAEVRVAKITAEAAQTRVSYARTQVEAGAVAPEHIAALKSAENIARADYDVKYVNVILAEMRIPASLSADAREALERAHADARGDFAAVSRRSKETPYQQARNGRIAETYLSRSYDGHVSRVRAAERARNGVDDADGGVGFGGAGAGYAGGGVGLRASVANLSHGIARAVPPPASAWGTSYLYQPLPLPPGSGGGDVGFDGLGSDADGVHSLLAAASRRPPTRSTASALLPRRRDSDLGGFGGLGSGYHPGSAVGGEDFGGSAPALSTALSALSAASRRLIPSDLSTAAAAATHLGGGGDVSPPVPDHGPSGGGGRDDDSDGDVGYAPTPPNPAAWPTSPAPLTRASSPRRGGGDASYYGSGSGGGSDAGGATHSPSPHYGGDGGFVGAGTDYAGGGDVPPTHPSVAVRRWDATSPAAAVALSSRSVASSHDARSGGLVGGHPPLSVSVNPLPTGGGGAGSVNLTMSSLPPTSTALPGGRLEKDNPTQSSGLTLQALTAKVTELTGIFLSGDRSVTPTLLKLRSELAAATMPPASAAGGGVGAATPAATPSIAAPAPATSNPWAPTAPTSGAGAPAPSAATVIAVTAAAAAAAAGVPASGYNTLGAITGINPTGR